MAVVAFVVALLAELYLLQARPDRLLLERFRQIAGDLRGAHLVPVADVR